MKRYRKDASTGNENSIQSDKTIIKLNRKAYTYSTEEQDKNHEV